jgi:carbon starvation protein
MIYTFLPMVFMMAVTLWAMMWNIVNFWNTGDWLLGIVASAIFILALWLVGEAYLALKSTRGGKEIQEANPAED